MKRPALNSTVLIFYGIITAEIAAELSGVFAEEEQFKIGIAKVDYPSIFTLVAFVFTITHRLIENYEIHEESKKLRQGFRHSYDALDTKIQNSDITFNLSPKEEIYRPASVISGLGPTGFSRWGIAVMAAMTIDFFTQKTDSLLTIIPLIAFMLMDIYVLSVSGGNEEAISRANDKIKEYEANFKNLKIKSLEDKVRQLESKVKALEPDPSEREEVTERHQAEESDMIRSGDSVQDRVFIQSEHRPSESTGSSLLYSFWHDLSGVVSNAFGIEDEFDEGPRP